MSKLFLSYMVLLLKTAASTFGQEYSFCSGDTLFSFSGKSCPGGIVLKDAIKIDEPCYCFGADLTIYEDCGGGDGVVKTGTFSGCQAPLIQRSDKWSGKAKFILPSKNITKTTGDVEFCPKIRDTCIKIDSGEKFLDPLFNEINVDSLSDQQRRSRQGGDGRVCTIFETNCTDSYTDKIDNAVRLLSYVQNPNYLIRISNVFNLMKLSVEVFKALAPDWIIPHSTLDTIFDNFHINFMRLDAITADRHLREETYLPIKWKLEQCMKDIKDQADSSNSSAGGHFIKDKSVCPPVGKFVQTDGQTSKPMQVDIPDDRKYIPEQEDLIIGALWKIMDTVHTKCLFYNVYYFTPIENIFLDPEIETMHYNGNGHGTSIYAGLVNQDDLPGFMANIDRINAAVHMTAKYNGYFQKPKRQVAASGRKKRSVTDDFAMEIWGGRAYCLLHKQNISAISKHPKLKKICSKNNSPLDFQCTLSNLKNAIGRNASMDCPQEGSGFKSGIYRVENGHVESCCYTPIKCVKEDKGKCVEACKQFCGKMNTQYFPSDNQSNEFCTCNHSTEFINFKHT